MPWSSAFGVALLGSAVRSRNTAILPAGVALPRWLTNTALKHYQETTKDLVAVSSISAQIRDAEARLENVNKTLAVVESRLARINAMA